MSSSIKKRRVGVDNSTGSGGDALVSEELIAIKSSTVSEMMSMMKDMQGVMNGMHNEMKDMRKDMNGMKKDISKLTKKCGGMEKSMKDIDETVDDVEKTLDDMKCTQKYLKALLQNQKWEYSVPRPSEEYWDDLDSDDDEDDVAEEFLADIQKYTEQMRYGSDGDIEISASGLLYHGELLPHWKEFANAIEQYQYHQKCSHRGRQTLSLWGVELSDPLLDLLSRALQSTYFEQFELGFNRNFGGKVIKFALNYLADNVHCKRFSLSHNPMNKMEDIKRLCEIVKEHPSIKELTLNACKGEGIEGYEMLKMIMTYGRKKLRRITLDDNSISTGGDSFISDFLANNETLKLLSITDNQFDDNDALLIAGAMKHNTRLAALELGDNNLTSAGMDALSKSLFDKTSLNSAADSNHTCYFHYGENVKDLGKENIETNRLCCPVNIRRKKVYSILSSRNKSMSNVDHFDDDMAVELLPHMLTTIERYANYHEANSLSDDYVNRVSPLQDTRDVKPLSIVFEILQRWDKSLAVFETLSS